MTEIKIPLSKKKNLLMILAAVVFIVLGVVFIVKPESFASPFLQNMALKRLVGVLSVVFFGAVAIYGTMKLFDKKDGLIISEEGIIDNTNASSVGLISWGDILAIETQNVMSTRFLLIFIKNPK